MNDLYKMKRTFKLACTLCCLFVFTQTTAAPRAAVRIERGTVVSDRGTLLRGTSNRVDTDMAGPEWKQRMRQAAELCGLNTVSLDYRPWSKGRNGNPETFAPVFDNWVRYAAETGQYLIVSYGADDGDMYQVGGRPERGTYKNKAGLDEMRRFWEFYAPRYAEQSHVLYEICNEPVAWEPNAYSDKDIKILEDMYLLIRDKAPQNHIIMWTFARLTNADEALAVVKKAPKVDYSNSCIGFHWYHSQESAIEKLHQSGYPVYCNEFREAEDRIPRCEKLGISWIPHYVDVEDLSVGGNPHCEFSGPTDFRTKIEKAGVSWVPDFGNWPQPRK